MTKKQIRQMRKTFMALVRACWYDGVTEFMVSIASEMERVHEDNGARQYHYSFEYTGAGYQKNELIWEILVLMFGDYGCSPRVGWITDIPECVEFIKFFLSCCGSDQEEEETP